MSVVGARATSGARCLSREERSRREASVDVGSESESEDVWSARPLVFLGPLVKESGPLDTAEADVPARWIVELPIKASADRVGTRITLFSMLKSHLYRGVFVSAERYR